MEKLMWEQIRADAFTKEYIAKDSSKDITLENLALQEKIFRKYKTNRQAFYKSYDYYLQHDNMMRDLLDSIIAKEVRAHEKEKELKKKKNEQNVP